MYQIVPWQLRKLYPMALFKSIILAIALLLISTPVFANSNCSATVNNIYSIQGNPDAIPSLDQQWAKISLPDNWLKRWPEYQGGVWYRINWQLNCPDNNLKNESFALTVNRITMAGQAYINQDLIWQDRSLEEPISRSWNKPVYLSIPPSSIKLGHNYFYIYVVNSVANTPGIGEILLGPAKDILDVYEDNNWSQRTIFIINICLSITLGFICFCIWLFRRQEKAFGWFSLSTLFWTGFIYNILTTETTPLPNSDIFMRVNIACFLSYIYCFCIFTWRFLHKTYPKIESTFFILNLSFLIVLIVVPFETLQLAISIIFYTNFSIFIINLIAVFYLSFKTKTLENWLLSFALFGCLILSGVDILSLIGVITLKASILPYSSTLIAIFLTITLSLHLTRSLNKIEGFNKSLNQKITETSRDLEHSLKQQYELALKNEQLQTRLKLSYELHDGLGSTLTQAITSVNYRKEHNLNKSDVLTMLKTLNNDLRQIVDLFKGNQQPLPSNPIFWLAPLRNRFNTLFDELSINIIWHIAPEWKIKPNWQVCSLLYRILEEALSNIIKHSNATYIEVSFEYDDTKTILKIHDNGIGFDVDSVFASGVSVGLQSMKNRAEQLNGQCLIDSHPQSTTITIII